MTRPRPLRFVSLAVLLITAGMAVIVQAAENTRSERLWLPASAANLRPFLQMAVDMALQDENCKDVLYARLNEYRTIYEEPTFTILCQKDPKSTFNRVIKITEVDPQYFEKIRNSEQALDTNRTLSPEIEALRRALGPTPAPTTVAPPASPAAPVEEDPNDLSLDLPSPASAAPPSAPAPAPAASH